MLDELLALQSSKVGGWDRSEALGILEGATASDLEEILEELDAFSSEDQTVEVGRGELRWLVEKLLTELKPELMLGIEYHRRRLRALAARSQEEALRWIEESDLEEEEKERARLQVTKTRLQLEPCEYLERWSELRETCFSGDPILLDSRFVSEISPLINRPEYAEVRHDLIATLLHSSMLDGVEVARSRMEELGVESELLLEEIFALEAYGSGELLDWSLDLVEDHPLDEGYFLQHELMARFAQRDLDGAGDWLRQFGGDGKVRDEMIFRYAAVLNAVDPEASLEWVEKIQDVGKREREQKKFLNEWEYSDPEGYRAWKAEQ